MPKITKPYLLASASVGSVLYISSLFVLPYVREMPEDLKNYCEKRQKVEMKSDPSALQIDYEESIEMNNRIFEYSNHNFEVTKKYMALAVPGSLLLAFGVIGLSNDKRRSDRISYLK